MPKISVLIPVFNKEKYLQECLDSVINQTETDIEILCVDDASTDASIDILENYSRKDNRIIVIRHEENKGLLQTRKDAVSIAKGEYTIFLDSDDFISIETCDILYRKMKETDVDFIQYGANLIPNAEVSDSMMAWVSKFMEPTVGYIEKEILSKGIIEKKFNPNVCNKICRTSLCKQVFERIEDGYYYSSEDRYATFLLFYYADSYYGVPDKLYHYRIGVGVTGNDCLTLRQYELRCKGAEITKKVLNFLKTEKKEKVYEQEYEVFKDDILMDCIDCWHNKLERKETERGFQILVKNWGIKDTIGGIASRYFEEQKDILRRSGLVAADNVAIYYRYVGYDAMDPVLDRIINENNEKKLSLLTDKDAICKERNYKNIPLYHIASATSSNWDKYITRCQDLLSFIKENEITKIIYLSPTSHVVELDRLTILSAKVAFSLQMDEYGVDAKTKLEKELKTEIEKSKKTEERYFDEIKKRKATEEENEKYKEKIRALRKERDLYLSEKEDLSRNMKLLYERQKELRGILQEIYSENNHIKSCINWLNKEREVLKGNLLEKNREIENLEKTRGYKALKAYWNIVNRIRNIYCR